MAIAIGRSNRAEVEAPAKARWEERAPPGRNTTPSYSGLPDTPLSRFRRAYAGEFHARWPNRADGAGYLLDVVADTAIEQNDARVTFRPASKQMLIEHFVAPFEDDPVRTIEDAEAALRFLVEQEMIEIESDAVSIHARFAAAATAANSSHKA